MRLITLLPCFRRSVSLDNRLDLPRSPGVYYVIQWFRPWRVLYCGMSGNINKRWNITGDRRHHKLAELRHLPCVRLHYVKTKTRNDAERLEAIEIVRWKPILNRKRERLHAFGIQDLVDGVVDSMILGVIAFSALYLLGILR